MKKFLATAAIAFALLLAGCKSTDSQKEPTLSESQVENVTSIVEKFKAKLPLDKGLTMLTDVTFANDTLTFKNVYKAEFGGKPIDCTPAVIEKDREANREANFQSLRSQRALESLIRSGMVVVFNYYNPEGELLLSQPFTAADFANNPLQSPDSKDDQSTDQLEAEVENSEP